MPVVVNPKACVNRENCFAANACPYGAFYHNSLKRTWEVDATVCGECPGPCINFCDKDAIKWGDDLVDLKFVKGELDGTMTHEQVLEARAKHKREMVEAAKKKSGEGVIELTRANFEREVLRSEIPVVVDCWAEWCGPCKQFSPIFEQMAKQYVGVVKFAKLDTEAEPSLTRGLGIQALPTVLMFYKGQLANAAEGALPAAQFQTWIYQTLAAIRQYEAQFEAEAGEAIGSASQRMTTLNESGEYEDQGEEEAPSAQSSPSGLILDTNAARQEPPSPRPGPGEAPGKQTASGLYIP